MPPTKPKAKAELRARKAGQELSKTTRWNRFQRAVAEAAVDHGIPASAFELSKVRAAPGAGSDAWKYHERGFAKLLESVGFTAKRISRGDDLGRSDVDIVIDEIPSAKVDCKYRAGGFVNHSLVEEAEDKYCTRPGDFVILPTKGGNEVGSFVTLRSEVFAGILATAYGIKREDPTAMTCPRCQGHSYPRTHTILGLIEMECGTCSCKYLLPDDYATHEVASANVTGMVEVVIPSLAPVAA